MPWNSCQNNGPSVATRYVTQRFIKPPLPVQDLHHSAQQWKSRSIDCVTSILALARIG